MAKETIKYKDPFLGEIELEKVGETSMNLMGESQVDTIYVDVKGNFWICSWVTTGGDPVPMRFLRKELIDKIVEIESNKTPNPTNHNNIH